MNKTERYRIIDEIIELTGNKTSKFRSKLIKTNSNRLLAKLNLLKEKQPKVNSIIVDKSNATIPAPTLPRLPARFEEVIQNSDKHETKENNSSVGGISSPLIICAIIAFFVIFLHLITN